ncbi:hypothetical protein [Vibrio tritonius]|uniref:hypothetical protein n=2 Tax=Vibrio tritonius TaxID=1435069 RepID=UPI0008385CD0|nr:hypothetical protein [Vibrio tritonius]
MQTSELHQRAQLKLNDGRNGYSLSTSLGAEMGLLMSSQRASCIRSYAALPIFYVESLCIQIGALPMSEYILAETAS